MGVLTALQIAQEASVRIGQAIPTNVVSNPSEQALTWGAALRQMARFVGSQWDWPKLTSYTTFVALAVEDQGSFTNYVATFDRLVPDTFLNVTQQRKCIGPLSPAEWGQLKAQTVTGNFDYFRILGNGFRIYPAPNGTDTYSFECITDSLWSSGNTFTLDTDVWQLDDELAICGTAFFWKMARGMDFGAEEVLFQSRAKVVMGRSKMAGTINVTESRPETRPGIYFPVLVP